MIIFSLWIGKIRAEIVDDFIVRFKPLANPPPKQEAPRHPMSPFRHQRPPPLPALPRGAARR